MAPYTMKAQRMRAQITKLLETAPKVNETDTPAIEAQIILGSGYQCVGALSIVKVSDESGQLGEIVRFLAMGGSRAQPGVVVAAEHYIDFDDLECVIIPRAISNESSIIVGAG